MKSFTVAAADDGQRLSRFIEKCVPGLPASLMYKYLRKKRIKVNGKRCEASQRLAMGDVIEMYLNDELFAQQKKLPDFMKASRALTVVYEDANIAVLYKPAGVLVHDDSGNVIRDTLINRFLRYLYEKGEYTPSKEESFTPALCNRLDRGTAGLVLAAKNRQSLKELDYIVKNRLIDKRYLTIAVGKPPKNGIYEAHLEKNEQTNLVRVTAKATAGSKPITTGFTTLATKGELSLIEVELITGRTHQIRAHLAYLGSPILGDGKYGIGTVNRRYHITRQALCAYKVKFNLADRPDSPLAYLDGKEVTLEPSVVWFAEEYFGGVKI